MNKYNESKIYKIVDNTNGNIYVGSTTQTYLCQRLQGHVKNYKQYLKGAKNKYMTSFIILENRNYDILLLENVECNTKDELKVRERHYIETLKCVNKNIPGRSFKEYYDANPEYNKQRNKKYDEENKEKRQQYRMDNKDKILERKQRTFVCECGAMIQCYSNAKHLQSKKHQKFMDT